MENSVFAKKAIKEKLVPNVNRVSQKSPVANWQNAKKVQPILPLSLLKLKFVIYNIKKDVPKLHVH